MGQLSISFYNSRQTGSLMTRVMSDAERVTGFYIDGLPYLFINVFTLTATAIVMFMMNWKLALAALIFVPILFMVSFYMLPRLWSFYGKRHRAERTLNSRLNDNLTGARVVKAFGQQEAEIDRFEKPNSRLKRAEIRIVKYNNRFTILYNFVQEISSIWVWIIGVFMILKTKEKYPNVRMFATTLRQVISANEHLWGAMLMAGDEFFVELPREIPVLDRIGGGDGFSGGLLYGVLQNWEAEKCLQFGWASGVLAASSLNDYAEPADEKQIWDIYAGNARVQR